MVGGCCVVLVVADVLVEGVDTVVNSVVDSVAGGASVDKPTSQLPISI